MKRGLLYITLLLLATSCNLVNFFTDSDVVAEVGTNRLTLPDVERILPKGISKEDSLVMSRQYVNSWSKRMLLYDKARQELSTEDKNVDRLLEEYKIQLLIFRYENKYLSERLDTTISDEEGLAYYNSHKDLFVSQDGAARGRYILVGKDSRNIQAILRAAKDVDEETLETFESMAADFAVKYQEFNDAWIDLPDLSREMECSFVELKEKLAQSDVVEMTDSLYTKIYVALDKVLPGKVAPYNYSRRKVSEIFLGRRKQEMLNALQEDIYREAMKNKEIKLNL